MYGKILIKGTIELLTGMHIGTGGEFAAIGAVDSPVVRDAISQEPILPGSSFKGKLRCMLAEKYNTPEEMRRGKDCDKINSLFGSMGKSSKLIFSDMHLCNRKELEDMNVFTFTETKFENSINRFTGVANPRQIERIIRGCKFGMDIIYNYTDEGSAVEDIKLLAEAMKLLQFDYLGGHGSRGYGKIRFEDLRAETVVGDIDDEAINAVLEDVKCDDL